MALHVDGHAPDGSLGFGNQPPFAVFDDERQDWLMVGLPFKWIAHLCCYFIERERKRQKGAP